MHHRVGPPGHRFAQRVTLPLLDLGELDRFAALHRAVSTSRRAPVEFRRSDYLGDPAVPLDDRRSAPWWPSGRGSAPTVRWPCWPCFAPGGGCSTRSPATSATTPQGAGYGGWWPRSPTPRGTIVTAMWSALPGGRHVFVKALHVSPLPPMDQTYRLRYDPPGSRWRCRWGRRGRRDPVAGGDDPAPPAAGPPGRAHPVRRRAGCCRGLRRIRQALALRAKGARGPRPPCARVR